MALDAEIVLRSATGQRRIPADRFITGYRQTALRPGEVIEAIRIPPLRAGQRFVAYKLSKRFDQDISAVVAAFRVTTKAGTLSDLRAFYGGMAATTARAAAVEAALTGQLWTSASLAGIDAAVARDFAPLDDQRATASYRLAAAANLLRRLVAETSDDPAPVRLEAL
jgi:xanthine dehydrogenase small subunit